MLNKILNLALLLNFLLGLVGCGVLNQGTNFNNSFDYETYGDQNIENTSVRILEGATVSPPKAKIKQTSKPKDWLLSHTQLDLYPDLDKQEMTATAWIWLKPNIEARKKLSLDAKYMEIEQVWVCFASPDSNFISPKRIRQLHNIKKSQQKLDLEFADPVKENTEVCLEIRYKVKPKEIPSGGSRSITNRIGLYFLKPDKYHPTRPKQLWTQGEPESASYWFPTLDAPNQKTTQVLRVHFPREMMSLSNGLLISTKINDKIKTQTWSSTLPQSPYLFMMAIGNFYEKYKKVNNKDFYYLVDPEYASVAEEIFRRTPEMLEYFSTYTGYPFPWQKYAQVIVHDFVSGAMENTTAVTYSEYYQKDAHALVDANNDNVVAHELFHHWFGDLVTMESWGDLSLSESFATLGSILWAEEDGGYKGGEQARYETFQNYLARSYEDEPPLIRKYYDSPGELFDHISYQKGASILYYLRSIIGENSFRKAMADYLNTHAFGNAEIADWRMSIEKVTGRDMRPFFDDWYNTSGVPIIKVWQEQIDSLDLLRTHIELLDSSESFQVIQTKIGVFSDEVFEDKEYQEMDIIIQPGHQYFDAKRGVGTTIAVLDPEHTLPARILREYPDNYWRLLAKRSNHFEDQMMALLKMGEEPENFQNQKIFEKLIYSKNVKIASTAAKYLDGNNLTLENREKFIRMISDKSVSSPVRAQLVAQMGIPKNNKNRKWLLPLLRDTSYLVRSNALWLIDSLNHDFAIEYAADSVYTAKSDLYKSMLALVIESGDKRGLDILDHEIKEKYGSTVLTPLFYAASYAKKNIDSVDFLKTIDLLAYRGSYDDLASTREYAAEKMFEVYIDQYHRNNIDKANFVRRKIEAVIDSWPDNERKSEFRDGLDWNVKLE